MHRPLRTLAAAALLACATLAHAGPSASSVLITSFGYTTTGGATLAWSDPYQSFATSALNAGGLQGADANSFDAEDYDTAISGASTSNATAAASTVAPQTFWLTANTLASIGPATNLPNQADSSVGQAGSFMLSAAGSVTFNIGYTLNVSSPGGNAVSDYGQALLDFSAFDSDNSSGGRTGALLNSFAQAGNAGTRTGTLSLTVSLGAGETGFYDLSGHAIAFSTAAAVPEPATWLMLAAGLAAMALRSRRA